MINIIKMIKGKESLGVTFWGYGFLGNFLLALVLFLLSFIVEKIFHIEIINSPLFAIISYAILLIWIVIVTIGIICILRNNITFLGIVALLICLLRVIGLSLVFILPVIELCKTYSFIKESPEKIQLYYNIGLAYYNSSDYFKAKEFFEKAAYQEHAKAQDYLGDMYASGYGVKQNYKEALKWYGKACDNGLQTGCSSYSYTKNLINYLEIRK